jgi:hypothetical protein
LQFVSESYLNAKRYSKKNSVHSAGLNIQQIGNYNDLNINMMSMLGLILFKGDSNQLEIDKEAKLNKTKYISRSKQFD